MLLKEPVPNFAVSKPAASWGMGQKLICRRARPKSTLDADRVRASDAFMLGHHNVECKESITSQDFNSSVLLPSNTCSPADAIAIKGL